MKLPQAEGWGGELSYDKLRRMEKNKFILSRLKEA